MALQRCESGTGSSTNSDNGGGGGVVGTLKDWPKTTKIADIAGHGSAL
jgi:hypothetical protein